MTKAWFFFQGTPNYRWELPQVKCIKVIGVILVIRIDTGEIVEADCTLATNVAREYVSRILLGQSLKHGPDMALRLVDKRYQGSAKKAIMTSFAYYLMIIPQLHGRTVCFGV